ncbi:dihydroorotate dehydrogenase electron transfer subunit [Virgibacillus oceani]|uniref:Dihydroorotate dehydrogenase B (NAD(+)), electron transfer subunit n=1 Tax=Virgibacillus oceani TaxID=1479511 RepID=A0A917M0B3_9BACI|nr:dihydroorotate dehydrogenase electron transfer subunit [Virgibacillus oceani]GGG69572.1 dihydroorotate dehydrogenase B (NAD(+)), electron transfer subunit [Virgibacillus oceani]
MKKQLEMVVEKVNEIALDTIEMTLSNVHAAKTAQPGQFLHLQVEGHALRRPISIADIDRENNFLTVLFKKLGDGTKRLAMYRPGMTIDALGPSGNGFSYEPSMKTVLLIGGGIGIPPLYNLGKQLKNKGIKVIAVLGYQSKEHVFYEEKFNELGETIVVTNDGSYGSRGFVTNVLDQVADFDYYFSCGPVPMLKAVTKALHGHQGYISLEERMGCGIGACFACVIPTDTEGGYRKICKDGPVFAVNEVIL